ncbi:efflux RND transporter periplasmic adaptor subunit [Maribacter sp. PR1]|uniref:Efflux RND transporter periplasmic adaptor subunit n=1 Tax=Maribacter cobaltidurans TaxID=1178778 RepID=A0ABU7IPJ1_9FLAO|nr:MULTISPECIES: efflux RND transporter periplasmic adaptor subunit [Maribacter]MDC6387401.1 efflux RND transporter periplasmic adaptor subunit [Maribacter sp. PR1]MEE1974788.1 efflux RND transporter periplasmic adaptor subunit [Maribacter cobaltidurans]
MKNNKIFIYIGILAVGVLLGWWVFGGSSNEGTDHNHDAVTETDQMWTCSMHPQIIQSEPGDCPICGMDLIFVDTESEGLAINEIRMTKNAIALANIATTIIGDESTITNGRITLSGRITINEESEAVQSSYFDGRLERLNVSFEGEQVEKGQLLATIYAPDLVAAQQELISSLSLKESQPALYKAVRNKLKLWKLSENQINTIEKTGKVKEYFPIYATVSGTVSEKMISEGDYVKQGEPLLKLMDLNSVWVEFDVYENQIASLEKGDKITLTTNAYSNTSFEATIIFIDPILNERTRTVAVRATLNNRDGVFKPGMFVKGHIESSKETGDDFSNSLMVPATAVMWTGERSVVYLKVNKDKPIYRMREVELGDRNGDMFVVNSGLQTGDEVVTKGTFTVDAAAQLQGKKSMMTQNQEKEVTSSGIGNMKLVFPDSFKMGFKSVLPSYFNIKNALVLGNATEVSEYSKNLLESLVSINESDLNNMGKLHFSRLEELLGKVASSEDLKYQRDIFIELNENMVPIVMNIGGMENPVYIQKCPMANNNKGAFWISSEKEIRNPYYGEQMMTCGSIIDTIN